MAPIVTENGLNQRTYFIQKVNRRKIIWPLDIFTFFDEVNYALCPIKYEEQFFIVVLMFAEEEECSKFRMELTVHGKGVEEGDPGVESVKFSVSPISIDAEKSEFHQFGFSEKFMAKILKSSKEMWYG